MWPPPYEHPHPTTYRYATSCSQFHVISICRFVYSDCLVGWSYNYVLCCIYPPLPPSPKCLTFHLTSPIRTQTFTLLVLAQEYVYLHLLYMLSRSAHYVQLSISCIPASPFCLPLTGNVYWAALTQENRRNKDRQNYDIDSTSETIYTL